MIVDHVFDVPKDFCVTAVSLFGSARNARAVRVEDARRLGIEDEGHGEQALDPFCGRVSP